MKSKKKRTVILVLTIIIIFLVLIPCYGYGSRELYRINNSLPRNLYIHDIDFGGLTLDQAVLELMKVEEEELHKKITILYDDGKGYYQSSSFSLKELGYYANISAVQEKLSSMMDKNKNLLERIVRYKRIERQGAKYDLAYDIRYDQFSKALEVFNSATLKAPVNARFQCDKGKIEIVEEEYGYAFDKEGLYRELLANTALTSVKLNLKPVRPAETAEQLAGMGISELVSSYTTKFDGSNKPRSANIKLAAEAIDGTILAPNETFSYNEVVGDRTAERGYQEAGVFINGKLDTGIGGGICQVSTTLYNAALLFDLKIERRSNHSLTVPYVPLSRDAAVSWGAQDLKFTNNTDHHIYLHSKTTSNSITFEIYSSKHDKEVELVSTMLSKISAPVVYIDDPSMMIGQEKVVDNGHEGFQSQLIKNVYVGGKLISSTILSKDKYLTAAKIIRRGTRVPDIFEEDEEDPI